MFNTKRSFSVGRIFRLGLVIAPIASIVILQLFLWVSGRPFVWGELREGELACVLQGPMTPFGRAMFVGGLPQSSDVRSPVDVRRVGLFFLDSMMEMLNEGYGFEPDGELYVRLGRNRVWTVNPWSGDVRFLAEIEVQSPVWKGEFSSNEFCVAGDVIWFETFDGDAYDTLFVKDGESVVSVFKRRELFEILGCSAEYAFVSWDDRYHSSAFIVGRETGKPIPVSSCGYLECFFGRGDWKPEQVIYLREHDEQTWFHLRNSASDEKLISQGKRYRAAFGCDDSIFFLTYQDLQGEGLLVTLVEKIDIQRRDVVESFKINGFVKLLAEHCPCPTQKLHPG